ncbi:hypothetical protein F7725_025534 [Dissostichus mawsoni]|uniref:E3 ubiquitin-protein ligase RNF139 n=1 Tax=Dissostichus mawsoni TaxID=36200 RepID=A0A7J5XBG4_DISMA|nr:hypothetical protein F7725_025534 [Dissostichus mawsoni]
MASTQVRLGQQALAVLDVALRVPCIFIIDAIFNSYYDPGSGWAGAMGKVLVRVMALFKFYTLFFAVLLGMAAVLINYYATSHIDFYSAYYKAALGFRLVPRNGPTLWLGMAAIQLVFGVGYVFLLNLQSVFAALVVLDIMIPLWGLMIELPVDVRQLVAVFSGLALALNTAVCLAMRLKWFYYSCRYVYLLVRHMYRIYGLQLLLEDTWKRIRFPDVLRVFWLTRVTAQALILVYVVRAGYLLSWDVFWDLTSNLIISGCDSTLTVLGMSAVISSVAHYLGLSILHSRNMCLLLTAILHFIHGMTDPVLMSLSASHVSSFRRHFPVLLVSSALFVLPVVLSYALWHHYALNTWLFAVVVSLTVYGLFMVDGFSNVLWEKLDDYVYYVRSSGNIIEFLFGVIMFGNGAYTMMFESGSKIRACMMCLHAYFNIYLQAKNGWKTFINRRTAVKKINSLPEMRGDQLRDIEDVCAICYQEFATSARITPCHHYFHALCLRKWLYIQDTCPMCHQRVYVEDESRDRAAFSNNNGGYAAPQDRGGPARTRGRGAAGGGRGSGGAGWGEPDNELLEDNDSIEYDEDEWGTQNGNAHIEEDYINDDTDSTED